ncbi:MAG TPA: filamentous hemagglutinin N-terminal domain-containing protein, partial [Gammaproteobacteria bacterium]|nr:filamentous hemagglutinin N-terminal domain-containing protein [Gammaproteobacteria bacterium]
MTRRPARFSATTRTSPHDRWSQRLCSFGAALGFSALTTLAAWAGPEGGVVVGGSGTISQPDANTTVINQNSNRLIINWNTFNVGAQETVQFIQPSASAAALNRILDQNPSQILGAIIANGRVFLINPFGVIFGEGAVVNTGSLVVSTLDISDRDFMDGNYTFRAVEGLPDALIVNRGLLQAAAGGTVTLVGGAVRNEGVIVADYGYINLAAGRTATIDFDGDGLIRFQVDGAVLTNAAGPDSAAVHNSGTLQAESGQILLSAVAADQVFARVVNNEGVIAATGVVNDGGRVFLTGSGGDTFHSGTIDVSSEQGRGGTVHVLGDRVALIDEATVDASGATGGGEVLIGGDFQGGGDVPTASATFVGRNVAISADARDDGDGGKVIVWADGNTQYYGSISARGGAQGGDGGNVEVSGRANLAFDGFVDTTAPAGENGTLLLDPDDIVIHGGATAQSDDGALSDNQILFADGSGTFHISEAALEGLSGTTLTLEANNSITVTGTFDNISSNAGDAAGVLALSSGLNLVMRTNNAAGQGSGGIDLTGSAHGANLVIRTNGTGSITLTTGVNGGDAGAAPIAVGSLVTATRTDTNTAGITINAEGDVTIGGAVTTGSVTAGTADRSSGAISITSTAGSVTTTSGGTLTTGSVTVSGNNNSATSGNITISANGSVSLGANVATGAASASLDGATSGSISVTATTGTISNAASTSIATGNVTGNDQPSSGGSVTLSAGGAIQIAGSVSTGTVTSGSGSATAGGITVSAADSFTNGSGGAATITIGAASGTGTVTQASFAATTDAAAGHILVTSGSALRLGVLNTLDGDTASVEITVTGGNTLTVASASNLDQDNVVLTADEMLINTTLTTTGAVTLRASTAGRPIELGATSDTGADLDFTDTELDNIVNESSLTIGSASGGAITDTNALSQAGVIFLAASTASAITLNNASNDFGTVGVTSGGNVQLVDANAIILTTSNISGTLDVTAAGNITDAASAAIVVAGTATLSSGAANDIILDSASNDFATVTSTSVNDLTLVDADDIALGVITTSGGGAVNVTADTISITEQITTSGGNVTLSASSGITSDADGDDIVTTAAAGANSGEISLSVTVAGDITLNSGTTLNTSSADNAVAAAGNAGNVTVSVVDGAISLGGISAFGGNATTAGNGGAGGTVLVEVTAATAAGRDITVAGAIDAHGGNSAALNGGAGGAVTVSVAGTGSGAVALAGVNASGGDGNATLGTGGNGGAVSITALGANATLNGAIDTTGGTGSTAGTTAGVNVTAATSGDIVFAGSGSVTATGATVNLSAAGGAIQGNAAAQTDVSAGTVNFTAAGGVGSGAAPIETAVTTATFTITGGDGFVTDADSIEIGTTAVTGNLTVASVAGNITDAAGASIDVTGTLSLTTQATDATITVDDLDITGSLALSTTGTNAHATVVNSLALDFATSSVGGNLTATATTGNVTDSGTVTVGGNATFTAANANDDITVDQLAVTGSVAVNTNGATGDATVVNATALDLAASSVGGNLTVTATTGDITQSGALTVGGDASFTLDDATARNVLLASAANDIGGTITLGGTGLQATSDVALRNVNAAAAVPVLPGALDDLTLIFDNAAVTLPDITLSGNLSVTAGGAITQAGTTLVVTGTTSLTTGGFAITLAGGNNDFGGAVSASNTGTNDITLNDSDDMVLGNITAGQHLIVTAAGNITDGTTSVISIAGTADLTVTPGSNITLGDDAGDTFNAGSLDLTGTAVTVTEDSDSVIANVNAAGNFTLTSAGPITDTMGATIAVTGLATFNAGANAITLGDDVGDTTNFGSLNLTGGAVTVTEDSAMALTGVSATSATLTAGGDITDAAGTAIAVTGLATFNAGVNAITLGDDGGDVTNFGSLSLTGDVVTVTEDSATELANTNATVLTLTSGGAITQTATTTIFVSIDTTLAAAPGADITLTEAGNDFAAFTVVAGQDVTVVDSDAITLGTATTPFGITGNLTVTSTGNINTANDVTAGGAATLVSNGSDITIGDTLTAAGGATLNAGAATITVTGAISNGGGATATAITLIADDMDLQPGATIQGGAGTVTLRPFTGGRAINLGNATGATTDLDLSSAEINAILTTGSRVVGDLTAGIVTFDTFNIGTGDIAIVTGADITDAAGVGPHLVAGDVTFTTGGGSVGSGANTLNVDVGSVTVTDTAGGEVNITSAGTTDTTYTLSGTLGAIALTQSANDMIIASLTTANPVTLSANTGAVLDDGDAGVTDVTATDLSVTAATDIDLDTAVTTLSGSTTLTGNVTLDEADGVSVTSFTVADGDFTLTAGGDVTVGNITVPVSGLFATLTITTTGAINNNMVDGIENLTAGTLALTAGTGIGATTTLEIAANYVSAVSTTGNIDIDSYGAGDIANSRVPGIAVVEITSITTGSGDITFDQAGGASLLVDGAVTTAGNMTFTRDDPVGGPGGMALMDVTSAGSVTATLTGSGGGILVDYVSAATTITLTAVDDIQENDGDIDGATADPTNDLVAPTIVLTADSGIGGFGTAAARIEIDANNLSATNTGSGQIGIQDSDDLAIGVGGTGVSVIAGGTVFIAAGGALTRDGTGTPMVDSNGGDIYLTGTSIGTALAPVIVELNSAGVAGLNVTTTGPGGTGDVFIQTSGTLFLNSLVTGAGSDTITFSGTTADDDFMLNAALVDPSLSGDALSWVGVGDAFVLDTRFDDNGFDINLGPTGTLSITADTIDITGTLTAGGGVTVAPADAGSDIFLGDAIGTGFNLSAGTLSTLAQAGGGSLTITSTGGGDIFLDNVDFSSFDGSLTLNSSATIQGIDSPATDFITSALGSLTLTSNGDISNNVVAGALTVTAGSVTVTGTGGNDVTIVSTGAAGDTTFDVATGGAGNVNLTQNASDLLLGAITTTGDVTLTATTGAVLDSAADTDVDVTANTVGITADAGIGSGGFSLAVIANNVTAINNLSGDIVISNDATTLLAGTTAMLSNFVGNIDFRQSGGQALDITATTTDGAITIENTGADLTLTSVSAGNGQTVTATTTGSGDVFVADVTTTGTVVITSAGAINEAGLGDPAADVSGNTVTLTAASGIGDLATLETGAANLTATNTSGTIDIANIHVGAGLDDIVDVTLSTDSGDITFSQSGGGNLRVLSAQTTTSGNVTVTVDALGGMAIENIASAGDVTLILLNGIVIYVDDIAAANNVTIASSGAILELIGTLNDDSGPTSYVADAAVDIAGASITLNAGSDIGVNGASGTDDTNIELASGSISADTTTGNIGLENIFAGPTVVSSLTTGTGLATDAGNIYFAQSGGGAVSFTTVTTDTTSPNPGEGDITLSNAGADLTAITVTAGGEGVISLTTTTSGDVQVGSLTAAGNAVTVTSAGSILDNTSTITANTVTLTAATGVGTAAARINTTAASLDVSVTGAGDIFLNETDDVTLTDVDTFDGSIDIVAGGAVTATDVVAGDNDASGDEFVTLQGTSIAVGAINAGTAGDVTLNATAGAITDIGVGVTADLLTADATSAITLDTTVTSANLSTSGVGGITITETNSIILTDVDTFDGAITVSAGGGINADDVVTGNNGDISLSGTLVALGIVNAGTGNVTVTATSGAISDIRAGEGAGNENVVGTVVTLTAATGIGTADDIDTAASQLDLTTGTGGIVIAETDAVQLGNATGGLDTTTSGDISVVAGGAITTGNTIVTAGNGNVSLQTTAGGITLSNAVTANGSGDVTLAAAGLLTVNAAVSSTTGDLALTGGTGVTHGVNGDLTTGSAGTITVTATANDVTMADGTVYTAGGGLVSVTAADQVVLGRIANTGAVTVTATAGDITDGTAGEGAGNENVVGTVVTLTAATGVGVNTTAGDLDTAAASLDVSVTGAGVLVISESDAVTLAALDTANGLISVAAGGAMTVTNVTSTTDADANDIALRGATIAVGTINAGTAGDVTLTATVGAITDNASAVTGDVLTLTSAANIGASGARITTTATSLDLTAGTGIFVHETNGVQLGNATGGVDTAGGSLDITVAGAITTGNTLSTGGAGTLTLATTAAGDITLSHAISTAGGAISVATNDGSIVTTGAGTLASAGGAISLFANDATVGDNASPQGVTVGAGITSSGGAITIEAADDVVINAAVNAGAGNVTMLADANARDTFADTDGAITSTALITGNVVTLTAGENIGTNVARINTAAVTLDLTAGTNIYVTEANGVTLAAVDTANGLIDIITGGTTVITNITSTTDADANDITVVAAAGDLQVGTINAGTTGDVTLTATAGAITDNTSAVTGDVLTLTAATGVGAAGARINTTAASLDVSVTGTGGIFLNETDAVTLLAIDTFDGSIDIAAGGAMTATSVTTGNNNAITLTSGGALTVTTVNAGTGALSLSSGGALTD